jgi:YD repeat-containing protein
MKLLSRLFVVLSIILLVTGCKKDPPAEQQQKDPCKVTSVSVNGTSVALTYNDDGTVSSVTSSGGTRTYTYSDNTVTQTTTVLGQFVQKIIVTQNSAGFATNVRTEYSADGSDWTNEVYEYDGNQVSKLTYTDSESDEPEVSTFKWSGGNLVSVTDGDDITTIDYYTDKPSQAGDYVFASQLVQGYFVFSNKNLVKTITDGDDVSNITYIFGDDGKINSFSEDDGSDVTTYNFTYQCD